MRTSVVLKCSKFCIMHVVWLKTQKPYVLSKIDNQHSPFRKYFTKQQTIARRRTTDKDNPATTYFSRCVFCMVVSSLKSN